MILDALRDLQSYLEILIEKSQSQHPVELKFVDNNNIEVPLVYSKSRDYNFQDINTLNKLICNSDWLFDTSEPNENTKALITLFHDIFNDNSTRNAYVLYNTINNLEVIKYFISKAVSV